MARRHIHINVNLTFHPTKEVKQVIEHTLSRNLNKKVIVYINTAASFEQLRSDTESWLDLSDDIKVDVLIIQGDLQPEVKFISAEQFTCSVDNPQHLINSNQFYPRILLATAGIRIRIRNRSRQWIDEFIRFFSRIDLFLFSIVYFDNRCCDFLFLFGLGSDSLYRIHLFENIRLK